MDFLAKNICHKPHEMLIIRNSAFVMEINKKVGIFDGDIAGKFLLWLSERERGISAFFSENLWRF